jgi:hypothetical protein
MKIYTTYFSKIKKLDTEKITPISICLKPVNGWKFPQYKPLATTWSILSEYKITKDRERFIERYKSEVLGHLDPNQVIKDLEELAGPNKDIAMVCYEKSGDFCHRHLVAEWLGLNDCELNI